VFQNSIGKKTERIGFWMREDQFEREKRVFSSSRGEKAWTATAFDCPAR
jgi:hypothetical protein